MHPVSFLLITWPEQSEKNNILYTHTQLDLHVSYINHCTSGNVWLIPGWEKQLSVYRIISLIFLLHIRNVFLKQTSPRNEFKIIIIITSPHLHFFVIVKTVKLKLHPSSHMPAKLAYSLSDLV